MDLYDHVHVDWSEGCIYGKPEDGNVWNHLFEPTAPPEGEFETVIEYPDQWLTYIYPAKLYKAKNQDWRHQCNELWNRCQVLQEHRVSALKFWANNGWPELAVLVRADTHAGEQIGGVNQTLERYAEAIREHLKPGQKVFAMTGDTESLAWLQSRFPVVYYPETIRSDSRAIDRHLSEPQTVQDAKNCLIEVLIMSMAETVIHPISNMATASLFINPSQKSVYLE